MRSAPVVAVVAAAVLAGCVGGITCAPRHADATLVLTALAGEAGPLPVRASGGTSVAGHPGPVPDSHGWVAFHVALEGAHPANASEALPGVVDTAILQLRVRVQGQDLPVRITNVGGGVQHWTVNEDGAIGALANGTVLRVWWAVDPFRADAAQEALPEGAPVEAELNVAWQATGCALVATGSSAGSFTSAVASPDAPHRFASTSAPQVGLAQDPVRKDGVGFQADYQLAPGPGAELGGVDAWAVYLPARADRAVGVVTFPSNGWTVNGLPGNSVRTGDKLHVFSAADVAGVRVAYDTSGTMAPDSMAPGPGLYVLGITLRPASGGGPAESFAYAVTV